MVREGGDDRGRDAFQSLVSALQDRFSKSRAGQGTWVATPASAPARRRLLFTFCLQMPYHVCTVVMCLGGVLSSQVGTRRFISTIHNRCANYKLFYVVLSLYPPVSHACVCMHAHAFVQVFFANAATRSRSLDQRTLSCTRPFALTQSLTV